MNEDARPERTPRDAFATTQWTLILTAASDDPVKSAAALESLCQRYWFPIYAFIRRRGHGPNQAEDLTQSFFEHVFQHNSLDRASEKKGRFRSYLLNILTQFLEDQQQKQLLADRTERLNRLQLAEGERQYQAEPVDVASPERLFDQRWAWQLVKQATDAMRKEYAEQKKSEIFAKLESALTGDIKNGWYITVAIELGMSEGAVRVTLHRMRRRFGELLRHEIAHTVSSAAEIDEEIRQLFSSVGV